MAHPRLGRNANLFPQVPNGSDLSTNSVAKEQNITADIRSRGPMMTVNGQPPWWTNKPSSCSCANWTVPYQPPATLTSPSDSIGSP